MIVTHVMKVETVVSSEDILLQEINWFWSRNEIGIAPEEKSVYKKFNEEIEFKKGRYVVQLPLKEYR